MIFSLLAAIIVAQNPIILNHNVYVAGIPVATTTFGEKNNMAYLSVSPKRIPIKWLPDANYWQTSFFGDSLKYMVDNEIIKTSANDSSTIENLVNEAIETKEIKEEITPFTLHKVINYLIEKADSSKYTVNIILNKKENGDKRAKKVTIQVGTPTIPDSTDFKELNNILTDGNMLVPVTFEPKEDKYIERRFFVERATIYYNGIGPVAANVETKLFDAKVELESFK